MKVNTVEAVQSPNQASDDQLGFEADLTLKVDQPIFRKAYEVPYKLREKAMAHLQQLEDLNIISPIGVSEWASPVVIVLQKDGEIRMVIDCKTQHEGSSQSTEDGEEKYRQDDSSNSAARPKANKGAVTIQF